MESNNIDKMLGSMMVGQATDNLITDFLGNLTGSSKEIASLKADITQGYLITKFLLGDTSNRPVTNYKYKSGFARADIMLAGLTKLIQTNKYIPPDGMIMTVSWLDIKAIFEKYKLIDSWMQLDVSYKVPYWDYMQILMLWDWTDKKPYLAEYHDCDDFALIFKSHMDEYAGINAVAQVIDYSSSHSYNLLIDAVPAQHQSTKNISLDIESSKLITFEPQSDQWEEVGSNSNPSLKADMYKLQNCKIMM